MSCTTSVLRNELKKKWTESNQGHVFQFLDQLSPIEAEQLWNQVESIDVDNVNGIVNKLKQDLASPTPVYKIEPVKTVKLSSASDEMKKTWKNLGYKAMSENQIVVLLIAGGEGSRLGSEDPKGMYNVGLLSGKSLFQIQAERLLKLQILVSEITGKKVILPWYIMTSASVDERTQRFFKENNYFGLSKDQVYIFSQCGFLPAVTPEGKIVLESKSKIVVAPNGNGAVWRALSNQGILNSWEKKGIRWVLSYCVDNILVKIADPVFLGFCIEKQLDIGAKVVPKLYPEERVGVLALRNQQYTVLEYSEIDEEKRFAIVPDTGELQYNASHLVINTFSIDFIQSACNKPLPYHIAKKIIPYVDEHGNTVIPKNINGWKLELFVFDIFEYANKVLAFETVRTEEFSPLKNSMASPNDNPETCRTHLSNLHKKWVEDAGGVIVNKESNGLFEISPSISYDGEGLEKYVKGKEFTLPFHLTE